MNKLPEINFFLIVEIFGNGKGKPVYLQAMKLYVDIKAKIRLLKTLHNIGSGHLNASAYLHPLFVA